MMRRVGPFLAALILGAVFVVAALPKIAQPEAFALAIYHYQLLPSWAINPLAIYLPWLELCAGVFVLVPRLRAGAAILLLTMLLVFIAAVGINLHRGLDIACGCFTVKPGGDRIGWWNIARNVLLSALTIYAWTTARPSDRLAGRSPSRPIPPL